MLLLLSASNGKNLDLTRELARHAAEAEVEHELVDLVELDWPLYTPARQQDGTPGDFERVEALFARASAFAFVAPEYNGSIPPTLTSLIAWLSVASDDFRALFNGKTAAIATHSGGGGQKVLVAMRLQLSHLGVDVIGRELLCTGQRPLNQDSARAVVERLAAAVG